MLTFYFSKGSSALAAHILLEEIGAPYNTVEVPIASGAHRTPAFFAINPKGRLPALGTNQGVLTENPAILEYLAATHPGTGLLPEGPFNQARARSLCAYLCATAHVAFAHGKRAARWTDDPGAIPAMQAKVASNLAECAGLMESHMIDGPWALGASYCYCDPYLFLMTKWMAAHGIPVDPYPRLAAHAAGMRRRTATQKVLALHGTI